MNRPLAATLLLLFCLGCDRMSDKSREIRINTPEGEVVAHNTQREPTPQTIVVVDGKDLAKLRSLDQGGPAFVSHYLPNVEEPGLKDYDAAFRAWQLDKSPPYSDQEVIDLIGGYLGNKCVADFGMEWVTVSDDLGTNYAVRSTKVEVMSFPFSSVKKRIENRQYDFVHGIYYSTKELLASGDYKTRETKP